MPPKGKTVRKKAPARRKPVKKSVSRPDLPPTEKIANMKSRFFDVRQSGIQGKGAFATAKIRKGQRIIEYTGERISNDEADSRYDEAAMGRHHTFLFTVTASVVVDGAINGNESIYINHSCDPNCEAVIEDRRIFIEAIRTIHPGDELVYDYQYERSGEDDDEMEKFYTCLCGAPNCRGSIMKSKPAPRVKKAARSLKKKSVRRKRS
ncbi:MAG: SET domain-containing protein-lysine N-methyltransferase [Gemmatimonadota bacterium]|nr:SET domain-containing protein-lysine N-methyltransferase [Gemmatimonadota bacterium]